MVVEDCPNLMSLPGVRSIIRCGIEDPPNGLQCVIYSENGDFRLPSTSSIHPSLQKLKLIWCGSLLLDQIQYFIALKILWIKGYQMVALPEWFGNLSSLQELYLLSCWELVHLPTEELMRRLTQLKTLIIYDCPKFEDNEQIKISHVPWVEINDGRRLTQKDGKKYASGKIINLMTTDAQALQMVGKRVGSKTGALPKGSALVPGCGSGYDVAAIACPEHYVVGLDISDIAIKKAVEIKIDGWEIYVIEDFRALCLPHYRMQVVLKADFFTRSPIELFDLILDYTFFCAIEPDMRLAWAQRICDILKPGGELITLMFPGFREIVNLPECLAMPHQIENADDYECPELSIERSKIDHIPFVKVYDDGCTILIETFAILKFLYKRGRF
ncbi:hypothetical protein CMV_002857 [Castanea mollissima]|uniref:R13L1/DRL21-like LRR repeat region domain-containing protein n=1 Tax=Castanea mollissima TaxID=60419 RepID=A0A8J4W3D3_9ROSI|nr:hypothetical protein CMV_002857 [Castanea mollissima]